MPDHWHAILSIDAVRAGLDVYGEKPFTHSLREGRALCDAVKRYGRVWQTGSWQRSEDNFHRARRTGRATAASARSSASRSACRPGYTDFARHVRAGEDREPAGRASTTTRGSGPAPWSPYCKARVHMNWRWNMDYGGGQLMDWVGHHLDIAHWGLGFERTGPVEVKGTGEFPTTGIYNSATRYWVETKYADGTPMVAGRRLSRDPERHEVDRRDTAGSGWIAAASRASRPTSCSEIIGPNEKRLYRSRDHYQNFLDCVRSRALTIAPAEVAHRSASVGHLGVIAIETGRTIKWDPGHRDDHRRPGGGTPARRARIARPYQTSGLRRGA